MFANSTVFVTQASHHLYTIFFQFAKLSQCLVPPTQYFNESIVRVQCLSNRPHYATDNHEGQWERNVSATDLTSSTEYSWGQQRPLLILWEFYAGNMNDVDNIFYTIFTYTILWVPINIENEECENIEMW